MQQKGLDKLLRHKLRKRPLYNNQFHIPLIKNILRDHNVHTAGIRQFNSTVIGIGVGLVVAGVAGKYLLDAIPSRHANKVTVNPADPNAKPSQGNSSWMSDWFSKNFYDGGFEEKMSKREAALILGVRESASIDRIKEAHRKVMLLNHPDKGGSAYLTAKVNEAKDLLLKGRV
jgi:hypothetical protein